MRAPLLALLTACTTAPRPAELPAPHKGPIAVTALRAPADLHQRVGARDKREPLVAVLGWASELGLRRVEAETTDDLLAWAERTHRLHEADDTPEPGDLLIFEHDVIGLAIGRDARGVTELIYLAGGVVRRGFVDASRPTVRRDRGGAIVNTYLRHGKRRDRTSRYLAGKLLSAVVRLR